MSDSKLTTDCSVNVQMNIFSIVQTTSNFRISLTQVEEKSLNDAVKLTFVCLI